MFMFFLDLNRNLNNNSKSNKKKNNMNTVYHKINFKSCISIFFL